MDTLKHPGQRLNTREEQLAIRKAVANGIPVEYTSLCNPPGCGFVDYYPGGTLWFEDGQGGQPHVRGMFYRIKDFSK